ncbi:MAG TPA: geranylgeranylglycerol-phosphate geranylgeranyltransferase [Puia sp.]|jgi:4-hydroxybenzoate polyprenyltransferase|nr:geranylgeranylglycerol-phosphate geranylgeranyltransferase [Puia sp.]
MAIISAFFRLIRWPNLLFIGLTQVLFYYFVIIPSFPHEFPNLLRLSGLICLTLSSVLIAAAGYIINDYFDLNIDRVNKPDKLVVEKLIKRRSAILWHWFLSGVGVVLGLYVSWKVRNPIVGLANLACVILLWSYSTTFKRKLLIGNVIISLLTAWVILVLYVCEFRLGALSDPGYRAILSRIFKFAVVYSGFAFIISLIREVVKDIEDMDGDIRYGCRTMPIVWGVNVAKVFTATWLVVLISALAVIQFYFMPRAQWIMIAYGILFIDLPLLWILRELYSAQSKTDYHQLSGVIKGVMLAGILSIVLLILP